MASTIRVEVAVNAEIAILIDKYAADGRLMECAVGAMGNVLATHDRASMRPSDQFDILAEVRRQASATIDALAAMQADAFAKNGERIDSVAASVEGMRGDATLDRDRVVGAIAESGVALIRDVGATVRACAEDVVPVAVALGMREHERADTVVTDARFGRVCASIESASASTQATVGARADALENAIASVLTNVDATRNDTLELRRRNDVETVRDTSSSLKGIDGESRLVALLRSRLLRCDGWTIEDVHAQPHACDIVVKRVGHAQIRIECKRKKQITRNDLDKFYGDLGVTGDHGLMVSLEGAVAPGHTQGFSFERVHTDMGMRWSGIVVTGLCVQSAVVADPDLLDMHQVVSAIGVIQGFAQFTDDRLGSGGSGSGGGGGGGGGGVRGGGVVDDDDGGGGGDGGGGIAEEMDMAAIRIVGDDLVAVRDEIRAASDGVAGARNRLKAALVETKAAIACLDKVGLKQVRAAFSGDVLGAKGSSAVAAVSMATSSEGRKTYAGTCRFCGRDFVLAHQLAKHERMVCKERPI
jgi:uncharacterized membrane protein YgcG